MPNNLLETNAMKKTTIYLAATAGLMLVGAVSCRHKDKTGGQSDAPEVNVALPEIDSIVLHKSYPGLLYAGSSATVVGRVDGLILSKNYDSGSYVEKGKVLFTVESAKYREAAAQVAAALATAESQYEYASRNYEALKEALKSDAVAQIEVVQAKSTMEQAAAAIKNARAALSQANLNLSYCNVTAPISGYITSSPLDKGSYLNGEGSPVELCTIYDNSYMVADFNIEDAQYEKMIGQNGGKNQAIYRNIPLSFSHPLPHSYTADLYYESPTINSQTGTMTLKGTVQNIDNELKDGMYATINLPYGSDPSAILIKDASIGTDQLGKYVYVVNDSDKVVYTPIKTGEIYRDSLRVVEEGLRPTDRYVTEALLTVRNGMKVNPKQISADKPGNAKAKAGQR